MMTEKSLPEAPVSVNFKGVTKGGFICQWTLRDEDEYVLIGRQVAFIKQLSEGGVQPYPRQPEVNGSQNTKAVTPPTGSTSPPTTPVEDLFFDAVELVGSTRGDKTYWKVKGGQFSKYGVTVWPEVLEDAGFNVDQLDPTLTYDLGGYTAYYSIKDDGKPEKVINLAK